MSDIKRILDAMERLAAAIPGTRSSTSVGMHGCDDTAIAALRAAGARVVTLVSDDLSHEWDCATIYLDYISISAHGRHRVRVEADPDAVDAAIAQAAEAVAP